MEDQKNTINDDQKTVLKTVLKEVLIDGPKKRGRKPKKISTILNKLNLLEQDNDLENNLLPEIHAINVPKKRGRKPKNQLLSNESTSQLNNDQIDGYEEVNEEVNEDLNGDLKKKRKRKSKKEMAEKHQQLNTETEVDIKLSREIDFSNDDVFVDKVYVEKNNDFLSNIWINKYQPQKLSEIIGNKQQIEIIKKWLLNYDNHKNHFAVMSGGHGIGKNLIIKLALQETGYQIKNICSTSLKNKNMVLDEIIHPCAKTRNVYNSINNQVNNLKYAIVIDDTESITLKSEKENLAELLKLNSQHKYFPIIFISNLQHSKLVDNLKKTSLEIMLQSPTFDQIKNYIANICLKEKMNITNDKIYGQIIKFTQCDIRRLLYVLQDLYYTYKTEPITVEMFKEYQHLTQKKDIDIGLFYAAKNLLDEYKNVNECLQLYETEKVLLPLTIYENYYRKIFKQKMSDADTLKIMSEISNSASIGDVIETNIYSDQNWFLQNIHGFYTCADISYTINTIGAKYIDPNVKETKKINYDLEFSIDLHKTSSRNINRKKNILVLQSKLKNKNIDDMLYINKIFFELEKNKSNSIIKSIKDQYGLDQKNILLALKIDKTNEKINEKNGKKFNDRLNNLNGDCENDVECDYDNYTTNS